MISTANPDRLEPKKKKLITKARKKDRRHEKFNNFLVLSLFPALRLPP